jgi:hypothetical protein
LAEGRAVDAVQWDVVDQDWRFPVTNVVGRGQRIEEFQQESEEAGFAAAGPAADGDLFPRVDG